MFTTIRSVEPSRRTLELGTSEAYAVVDLWKSALQLATSKLSDMDVVAVNAVS